MRNIKLIFFVAIIFFPLELVSQSNQAKFEIEDLILTVKGETNPEIYSSFIQTKQTPNALLTFMFDNVYERFGREREYFEPLVFTSDLLLIKRYLDDNGFFNAKVDTSLKLNNKDKVALVRININENIRSKIDSLKILGFDSVDSETNKLLSSHQFILEGDYYNRELIDKELERINKICFDNGYRLNKLDTVIQFRYLSTNNLSITLKYSPGEKYQFGKISLIGDTLLTQPEIIFRHLDFKEGDIYSESVKSKSDQNINQLGIFDFARIDYVPIVDSNSNKLPIEIYYKTRSEFREIVPEVLVNEENNTLNTGVGISFNHKNFFGDARKFSTRFRFSFQSLPELDLQNALKRGVDEPSLLTKTDLHFQLTQPYFFSTRTTSTLDGIIEYDNQKYYSLNTLRSRFGIIHQFAIYTRGFIDFNVERVSIIRIDTLKVDLNTFTGKRQKQFNSMLSFTIQRNKTDDMIYPSSGYSHTFQLEEAGTISRSLSSLSNDLPYSEYIRLNLSLLHYFDIGEITKMSVLALKLKSGYSHLYNPKNTTPVPPSRKFYMGGGSSVRGWKSRSLGAFTNPEQGGNIMIESSGELRYQLFSNPKEIIGLDISKIGITFFVDAGTIWDSLKYVKLADIAIASGIGFRYNTIIGPIRIDLGFRVYDPFESLEKNWITERKLFQSAYSRIEIGLGNTF